jgi:hypothetical protein
MWVLEQNRSFKAFKRQSSRGIFLYKMLLRGPVPVENSNDAIIELEEMLPVKLKRDIHPTARKV